MRQDPCQPDPRVDLLVVELAVDVVDGYDPEVLLPEADGRGAQGEVGRSPLGGEGDLPLLARQDVAERAREVGADPVQLQDMRQDGDAQQAQRLPVFLVYEAPLVDDDDARLHGIEYELVIFFLLDGFRLRPREDLGDLGQGLADQPVVGRAAGHGVLEGEIVVVDRVEHEGDLAAVLLVERQEPGDGDRVAKEAGGEEEPMRPDGAVSAGRREDEQRRQEEVLVVCQSGGHGDGLFL